MATVTTYDPESLKLAEYFLAGEPEHNTEEKRHLLALEIQQCIEDEIWFMQQWPSYPKPPKEAA